MNDFIIRNFKKKEAVKVYYVGIDKKVKIKWVLPKESRISFDGKSYLLTPDKIFIHDGVSTIFVNYLNAEPIDITRIDYKVFTPDKFDKAIGSKVVEDLIAANQTPDKVNLGVILAGVTLLAVVYLFYVVNKEFGAMNDLIQALQEQLKILGGV